jgi:hypothetical protein
MAMPPKKLKVKIRKLTNIKCETSPRHFVANPGSEVIFEFAQEPNADINFLGQSPFETSSVKPGRPHIVKTNASGRFEYEVRWAGAGDGNGTGEVIPVG